LVIVSPNQISVTNNSKTTVRVIKSTVIYADYSYVEYNMPGKPSPNYGPIVTMSKTWDESTELKTGQTLYKTINLRNIVALRSCSFDVKDSLGRVFTITPLSVSPAPTPTVSPTSTPYTFKIEDFPIREQSPTQLTLTNNSPVKVYVYGVEFKTGTWRGWKEGVSAGSGRLALLESGQTYIYNYPSFVSAAPPALTFTIEFNTYDNNARKTYTIDFTPAPK